MPIRCLSAIVVCAAAAPLGADEPVSFRRDVAPILLGQCQACHGPQKAEGGYRVDTFARLLAAGDSELPGIAGGKLDDSEAFRRITTEEEAERMPADSDPLPEAQIALIRRWIEEGAKYDGGDKDAPLAAIVPPPVHPDPPEAYPHTLPITALAFREADEKIELFVGGYHEITVWNAADGSLSRRIENQGQRTYALHVSGDGMRLAAAGGTPGKLGELRLFHAATGELAKVLATATDVVLDAAFSPDGRRIATGGADHAISVFDMESGERNVLITSHSDWIHAVAWSPDGKRLAGASRDKTAKIFDSQSGELAVTYNGHGQSVHGVAFHPDGKQVYSSAADGRIHLWNISDAKKTADVANFGGAAYKLHVSGRIFVAPSNDKTARLFSLADKKQMREFKDHSEWVLSAAISPDGKRIATGAFDGRVKVFHADSGELITVFVAAPGYDESGE